MLGHKILMTIVEIRKFWRLLCKLSSWLLVPSVMSYDCSLLQANHGKSERKSMCSIKMELLLLDVERRTTPNKVKMAYI
jgi:hypothetical protein